jgi:hypothetical protein
MEQLIQEISKQIAEVEVKLKSLTESELSFKKSTESWSKKEILGHLVDSAQNNIRRMVVGQYRANENIIYDQNIWVNSADYQHYNSNDLIHLFVLLNKHFCIVLKNLPKETYKTLTNWGNEIPELVSLEYVAHDYLKHLKHHINQLFLENYSKKFGEL